jgi:hypothetical protein
MIPRPQMSERGFKKGLEGRITEANQVSKFSTEGSGAKSPCVKSDLPYFDMDQANILHKFDINLNQFYMLNR